jgi:hypothetical protein
MKKEVWKEVEGSNGKYEVSDLGRVRSFAYGKKPRMLGGRRHEFGYVVYNLRLKKNVQTSFFAHRLVMKTFNPKNDEMVVCHIDNDPSNNALSNLEWGSQSYNNKHMVKCDRQAKGSAVYGAKLTEQDTFRIKSLISVGVPRLQIAQAFGVAKSTVHKIAQGKNWKHIKGTL